MDFAKVLAEVAAFLEARGLRYAVAGAFGLHAYGLSRATSDLDLVVESKAQAALLEFLAARGYEQLYASEGYSNHLHTEPARGRLDFIYLDEVTAGRLFGGSVQRSAVPGVQSPVPRPEHLAAMKVLAMKNDPSRTFRELADLQFLLGLPGVDKAEIRGYFERHGLQERFDELERALAARGA